MEAEPREGSGPVEANSEATGHGLMIMQYVLYKLNRDASLLFIGALVSRILDVSKKSISSQ